MTKVLFDTNVYTALLKEGENGKSLILRAAALGFGFCGFEEVRYELKSAPRMITTFSKNLRADLLRLYEAIIMREYLFEQRMMDLAVEYYEAYRTLGGGIAHRDIITDFLIVACASLKQVGVVVSQDSKSMLNFYARKAYAEVNARHDLAFPKLWAYEEFKAEVAKKARIGVK